MSDSQAPLRFLGVGFEFAVAVVGLTLAGFWFDRHFQSAPWGILGGMLLGLTVATYNLLRSVRSLSQKDSNES